MFQGRINRMKIQHEKERFPDKSLEQIKMEMMPVEKVHFTEWKPWRTYTNRFYFNLRKDNSKSHFVHC